MYLRALLIFFLPSALLRLVKSKHFSIGRGAKIGFSLVVARDFHLGDGGQIGHFNLIQVDSWACGHKVFVGSFNIIRGKLNVSLADEVEIYKQNKISAPMFNVAPSAFVMRRCARLAVGHLLDLTHNVEIGDGSILAGVGSQIWTHSFYYSQSSFNRVRVDKPVSIGAHCYIGSSVVVCAGVSIADGCTVGAATCVPKSLTQSGLYVGASVRRVDGFDADAIIEDLGDDAPFRTDYNIYHS